MRPLTFAIAAGMVTALYSPSGFPQGSGLVRVASALTPDDMQDVVAAAAHAARVQAKARDGAETTKTKKEKKKSKKGGDARAGGSSFNLHAFSQAYRRAVEDEGYFDLVSPGKRGAKAKDGEAGYMVSVQLIVAGMSGGSRLGVTVSCLLDTWPVPHYLVHPSPPHPSPPTALVYAVRLRGARDVLREQPLVAVRCADARPCRGRARVWRGVPLRQEIVGLEQSVR